MSKEEIIEALKSIKIRCHSKSMKYDPIDFDLDIVEKSLKSLEIIKEKDCDVSWLKYCIKGNLRVEAYNSGYPEYHKQLTEEEFDLLKEVLE